MSHEAELNGLNLEKLRRSLDIIREQASDADKQAELNVRRARALWTRGLKVKVFCGRASFKVDEPVEPTTAVESPTAIEYVLGGLAACVAIGFIYNATLQGIQVDGLEVVAEGKINNILTFLGLSREGHAGFDEIMLKLYVRASASEEALMKVLEYSVATSPVANTMTRWVSLRTELKTF